MKILFIDTETGGLNPNKHSLLSVGMAVWEDGEIVDTFIAYIASDEYVVTSEAMGINNIDISLLSVTGWPMPTVALNIKKFIDKNFGKDRIIIGGHNVHFDMDFLKVNELDDFNYSHRYINTASILQYLSITGLERTSNGSDLAALENALDHFNITEHQSHNALDDAINTAKLFTKLTESALK